jgi:hypothetical protein
VNRRCDPAARRRDLLVRFALKPAVELRLAVAGEWQMRMRVDKARNRGGAARVEIGIDGCVEIGVNIRLASDECEAAVADDDDRILVDGELAQRTAAQRAAAERRGDLGQIANQ